METFGSRALADTLSGVGQFFRSYDVLPYAHRIPVTIDYRPSLPVEEDLRGAPYIQAYLERRLAGNALLTRFAQPRVTAPLRRAPPDYRELPNKLYDPAAACAVGPALLGKDMTELEINRAQAADIRGLLSALPPDAARERLAEAAQSVCGRLEMTGAGFRTYLR